MSSHMPRRSFAQIVSPVLKCALFAGGFSCRQASFSVGDSQRMTVLGLCVALNNRTRPHMWRRDLTPPVALLHHRSSDAPGAPAGGSDPVSPALITS